MIDSKQDGTCDSPVAHKEKATDPYVNSTGSLTLLLQLESFPRASMMSPARGKGHEAKGPDRQRRVGP